MILEREYPLLQLWDESDPVLFNFLFAVSFWSSMYLRTISSEMCPMLST